jgi:copper chaperone NosL
MLTYGCPLHEKITRGLFLATTSFLLVLGPLTGCGLSESEPVDIGSGDVCAFCGKAISKPQFGSEIIYEGKVYKFDDLTCLNAFKTKHSESIHGTAYLIEYASRRWIRSDAATIVATDVATPMGSGLLAFADSAKANAFAKAHPPKKAM